MSSRRVTVILGRTIHVLPQAVPYRALLRTHMRRKGVTQKQMAALLGLSHGGFRKWIVERDRQSPPQYIDKIIQVLNLSKPEALQIRLQAAIEQGWQLDALKPAAFPQEPPYVRRTHPRPPRRRPLPARRPRRTEHPLQPGRV